MRQLERHAGSWTGTNGFRLQPDDPLHSAPASATVAHAVQGRLTQLAYTWTHPTDGDQDGLLVLGSTGEADAVAAFWGDSWHQSREPRLLDGTVAGAVVTVGYDYSGDWRWELVVDASAPDVLALTMNNVVPASAATADMPAGPYAAMTAVLRRAR